MIQILGLRPRDNSPRPIEVFFEKGWRFNDPMDLFDTQKLSAFITTVPEDERWNLYFTVAHCFEQPGRKLKEQWMLPFDIDGISLPAGKEAEEADRVARIAAQAIGVDYKYLSVVYSGHGVQFFIHIQKPINDETYFDRTRTAYGVLLAKIQEALKKAGVEGKTDPSVWSRGRLMRLAMTENRKKNKPPRTAVLIQKAVDSIDFTLEESAKVLSTEETGVISDKLLAQYPKPDTISICQGCKFLDHCHKNQASVTEPQWYAMTSITARLDNGAMLTHEYSKGHPDYTEYETDVKIEQALKAAGPRTCASIGALWDGCKECEHFGKITSPILIRGKDYLISKDFGFRDRIIKKVGEAIKVTPGAPAYEDLIKYFYQLYRFKTIKETTQLIVYDGVHWRFFLESEAKAWMTNIVIPSPSSMEMGEFYNRMRAHNLVGADDLYRTREGMVNFSNCVVNFITGETFPHSPDFGFFDVRPFAYDPQATAPIFNKFLMDVMDGDEELADSLKEFGGYCVSGDRYWMPKALVLSGTGRNGKSVYMRTLGKVVGEAMHSTVSIQDLKQPTMAYRLVNKCFNYSEETSEKAFTDAEFFKKLTDGSPITVKQLYVQPYEIANKAKIIISANTMPYTNDTTYAFFRRLAIIPFNVRFVEGSEQDDPDIENKLEQELPGICNVLLHHYKMLKLRRTLKANNKITRFVDEYRSDNDTVLMFLTDYTDEVAEAIIKCSEMYLRYTQFCETISFKPINAVKFGREYKRITGQGSEVYRYPNGVAKVYKGRSIRKDY